MTKIASDTVALFHAGNAPAEWQMPSRDFDETDIVAGERPPEADRIAEFLEKHGGAKLAVAFGFTEDAAQFVHFYFVPEDAFPNGELPETVPQHQLDALGIAAGSYERFLVDPADELRDLFETTAPYHWLQRPEGPGMREFMEAGEAQLNENVDLSDLIDRGVQESSPSAS